MYVCSISLKNKLERMSHTTNSISCWYLSLVLLRVLARELYVLSSPLHEVMYMFYARFVVFCIKIFIVIVMMSQHDADNGFILVL